tara:strand:+ start:93 stop:614 length:522 start_codon:yes stop_codon:yes gene_type:complete
LLVALLVERLKEVGLVQVVVLVVLFIIQVFLLQMVHMQSPLEVVEHLLHYPHQLIHLESKDLIVQYLFQPHTQHLAVDMEVVVLIHHPLVIMEDLVVVVHILELGEIHNNQHQTLVLPNMDMLVVMEEIEVLVAEVELVALVKTAVLEIQFHQLVMVELVFSFRQHLEILLQQ